MLFRQLLQRGGQTAQLQEALGQDQDRQVEQQCNAQIQVRLAGLWGVVGGLPQTGRTQTQTYRRKAIQMQVEGLQLRHCQTLLYDHSRKNTQTRTPTQSRHRIQQQMTWHLSAIKAISDKKWSVNCQINYL